MRTTPPVARVGDGTQEECIGETERAVALMQATGFNTVRIAVEHVVWLE